MAETKTKKETNTDVKSDSEKPQKSVKKSKKRSLLKEFTYIENIVATCVCGAEFKTGSTIDKIRVDICSNCHPLFTGEARIMDTEGRIEKFKKKYNIKK